MGFLVMTQQIMKGREKLATAGIVLAVVSLQIWEVRSCRMLNRGRHRMHVVHVDAEVVGVSRVNVGVDIVVDASVIVAVVGAVVACEPERASSGVDEGIVVV